MAIYLWNKQTGKREKLAGDNMLAGLPIGATIAYISEIAPRGFLPYDGSTYLRSDYPELYEKVPASWKINETQFTIPDAKGRTIQGADGNLGELIEAGLPNITGSVNSATAENIVNTSGALKKSKLDTTKDRALGSRGYTVNIIIDAADGETKTDGTLKTADEHHVYGSSDTVQPPAIALYYFIKATNYTDVQLDVIDDQKFTADNVLSAKKVKEELDQRSNYFTEETVIGEFLGKPLYRRLVENLNFTIINLSWITISIANNFNYITKATAFENGGNNIIEIIEKVPINNNSIRIETATGGNRSCNKLLLEYTKTTD